MSPANIKKGFIAVLFATSCLFQLSAYNLKEIISEDVYNNLKKENHLERTLYKPETIELILAPDTSVVKEAVKSWPADQEKPVYVSEQIYLLNKKTLGSGNVEKNNIDKASKILRSASKMQGMQYYSSTEKKVTTLYKECYSIKGPGDRTKIADDIEGNADGKTLYCLQNDHSFGKTEYRLQYHQTETEVNANFLNVSPLYVGIIKGVDSRNLSINIVVTDCGEDLLVYLLVQAKFPALSMFEDTMNDSFTSRLNAITNWFIEQFNF